MIKLITSEKKQATCDIYHIYIKFHEKIKTQLYADI